MDLIYKEHEGQGSYVESYKNVSPAEFRDYLSSLMISGYSIHENNVGDNSFVILRKGDDMVLVAYYSRILEMRIVTEPNSSYFSFKDTPCEEKTEPLLIQVDLVDPAMSYAVRLCDGRFIVFDGGFETEDDADRLMKCLKKYSPHERPIIAAWIQTHPHVDHYRCYLVFDQKYADDVVIERYVFNFPDAVLDPDRLPDMTKRYENVARFFAIVERVGAPVYKAHTGQTFELGGAKLKVLSSPDDNFFVPVRDFNNFSLVIKMTIAGQEILWTGDCSCKAAKLAERFGEHLKADILQVPHHMFYGGDEATYAFVNPHTCVVPSLEENVLGGYSLHRSSCRDASRFLVYDLDVQDFFASGNGDVVLHLPYTPRPNGKRILLDKIGEWQRTLGARSWYFDDVTADDCDFTIINPIYDSADIYADLLFEDSKNVVESVKITVPRRSFKRINLMDPEDADPDALSHNKSSLAKKGIPEGAVFAVHFKSSMPIVIKGKNPAVYCG